MEKIYTTPNGEWTIIKPNSNLEWVNIFGNIENYLICKNNKLDENEKENYTVLYFVKDLNSAFRWLRYVTKSISSDEMKYQMGIYNAK